MNEEQRIDMLNDLNLMSAMDRDDSFRVAEALWKEKWEAKALAGEPGVRDCLNGMVWWFGPNVRNWYVGALRGHCNNNQGVESTFKSVKMEITGWELLTIIEFLDAMCVWLEKKSRRRMVGHPAFVKV